MSTIAVIVLWVISLMSLGLLYGAIAQKNRTHALIGLVIPIAMLFYGLKYFDNNKWSFIIWIASTFIAASATLFLALD